MNKCRASHAAAKIACLLATVIYTGHSLADNFTSRTNAAPQSLPVLNTDNESKFSASTQLNTDTQQLHSRQLNTLTEIALQAILEGRWEKARLTTRHLVDRFPDFALGQYLLAESHRVVGAKTPYINDAHYSPELVELLLEARSRAQLNSMAKQWVLPDHEPLPKEIVQVGKHIENIIYVDLESSILYLYNTKNQHPTLVNKHYVSSGRGGFGKLIEGDLKSPLGVYRIQGFRSDDSLPELYGAGALMLNYPNTLDRSLGRTGSGIWLHGIPVSNRSRSPRSSEGCVTMANDHLLDLYKQIDIGRTHVMFAPKTVWHTPTETQQVKERYQELFDQYKTAWTNNHIANLTSLYSADSLPVEVQHAEQSAPQKVSSSAKPGQHYLKPQGISLAALAAVEITDVSLLLNPAVKGQPEHLIMEFEVDEQNPATVTLYWEQNAAGYWQIKRERINAPGV